MARELVVVLSDGSLESAVVTALASQKHRLAMVHLAGEEPVDRRLQRAFEMQAAHLEAQRTWVVPLGEAPGMSRKEARALAAGYLPRIAEVAVGSKAAVAWGAPQIHLSLRTGPAAEELLKGTEFLQICNELIQIPAGCPQIEVSAPLLELEAWQVVDLGMQIGAPMEMSWSCQSGEEQPCHACPGCKAREEAFGRAAKPDPLLKLTARRQA